MKSHSVNRAPGIGLMITKIPPSVSYSKLLYFLPCHLCRGKASDGRSWKGEATGDHGLSVCEGSGAGNSSHFCYWLDAWPWANHVSSMGLAPCLSLCVIQNSVKCCCSDLIPFSIHSWCCTGVEKRRVRSCLLSFIYIFLSFISL